MLSTNDLRQKTYEYILRSGAAGLTDEEIGNLLGIDGYRARDRRLELVQSFQVITAPWRRTNSSGREAAVWISTKAFNSMNGYRSVNR